MCSISLGLPSAVMIAFIFLETLISNKRQQARRKRGRREGVSYPGPRRLGAPPSLENIKYTKMLHLKKTQKLTPQIEDRKNGSPGSAVALDGPAREQSPPKYRAYRIHHCSVVLRVR